MTDLHDRLKNAVCRSHVGGDLSPGQIAEVIDTVLALLASEPVSDEAIEAFRLAFNSESTGNTKLKDAMRPALAAGWRALLGVKPSCPACGGTGCASCLEPER